MRYQIWDKTSNVLTPSGEVFSPEEWISRYRWIAHDGIIPVIAAGTFNGAYIGELSQMVAMYERRGADFSSASTNDEKLAVIEAVLDEAETPSTESTPEERIAAALEYQNILNSPTVNTDDPDLE